MDVLIWLLLQLLLLCITYSTALLLQGQQCTTYGGDTGICERVHLCNSSIEGIGKQKRPTICSFDKHTPLVCCKAPDSRSKSTRMCEEYSLFSRPKSDVPQDSYFSSSNLNLSDEYFAAILGSISLPKMYPHMAAIGYGDKDSISWLCGGSLISKQYVLTAAHCVSTGDRGVAKWVLLGVLNLKIDSDDHPQLFSVVKRIRHPDYRLDSNYHDIALLKLDREASIDDYVRPACLQVNYNINNPDELIASGWGVTSMADEEGSNYLMKVELPLVPTSKCNITFRPLIGTRKLMFGIQDDKMLCAGQSSGELVPDTCRGDSGGPLQYSLDVPGSMVTVVGITSFGSDICGYSPGVYTRVSYYVPWIESIVWPSPVQIQQTTIISRISAFFRKLFRR